jgi:hypothetical protein
MKKLILASLLIAAAAAHAVDSVQPQTLSGVRNLRDQATIAGTTNIALAQGATLRFTNCLAYADATGSVVQGLDGVTCDVGVGSSTTSIWYRVTVQSAAQGKWAGHVTLPRIETIYWQLRLTDAATNIYYYPQQSLRAIPTL